MKVAEKQPTGTLLSFRKKKKKKQPNVLLVTVA
jgi:hypothetical protein